MQNGRVVGIDSSARFIEFATAEFPPGGYPNLRFAHVDTRRIDLEESFDLAFSNAVLH